MVDFILTFCGFICGALTAYGIVSFYDDLKCKIFSKKRGHCNSSWCRARKICPYSEDFISKNIYGKK